MRTPPELGGGTRFDMGGRTIGLDRPRRRLGVEGWRTGASDAEDGFGLGGVLSLQREAWQEHGINTAQTPSLLASPHAQRPQTLIPVSTPPHLKFLIHQLPIP